MQAVLNNLIINEPKKPDTKIKTDTGIILQNKEDKSTAIEATIISIGPEVSGVTTKDTILISPFAGEKFTYKDKEYRLITDREIIAIM